MQRRARAGRNDRPIGRTRRFAALLAAPAVAGLILASCGPTATSSGAGTPQAGGSTAASSISPSTQVSSAPPSVSLSPTPSSKETPVLSQSSFELRSPAFAEGASIPRKYTCDGPDVSPALEWSGAPDGTTAMALIVEDPDARDFVHWVAFNLTGSASGGLTEAVSESPDAPPQGRNGFGKIGYGGPCPPSGSHRYVFTLYALSSQLELPGVPSAADVRRAAEGRVIGQARLSGRYRRG